MDTLDLRPLPDLVLRQFTARDVFSRWDVVDVFTSATAAAASQFLEAMKERFPFPIGAIQVDGGLPPRSPKLNGQVERAQRTHTEEFWECYDGDLDIASARKALRRWEHLYNTYRPHSLKSLTPKEYLTQCHPETAST